ncbi:MAG: zinc metallopeptidase [Thermotogota bacterium]|nr:zinc metallopeptidase [Thermotogota bacterium]
MFLDPTFVLLIPAIILAIWAQNKVNSSFSRYSKVKSSFGMTGSELARHLLDSAGLYNIKIENIKGKLTDHYDPKKKVVRLSESTRNNLSVAALGVVAHEIGHVIQDKKNYTPLVIRNAFAPVANIGSGLSWIIFIIGFLFWSPILVRLGIILFSLVVLFTLITLPVEYNASNLAKRMLTRLGMPKKEVVAVNNVLSAAALTYVASTLMAALQLMRMIFLSGFIGGDS